MINSTLRWSFTYEGWQYRLECIPRMDSFVPTYVAASDITAVAGYTAMPDTSLIKQQGLKEKREYDKSTPIGMQLASELQITLDYSELTAAQQEILLKPAVNIGSDNGIDYILTNVWTLKTDRGSSGVTWYVESQLAQRRTPEQEFTYDAAGSVTPTEITLTLHDIRRVLMEAVEIPTSLAAEVARGNGYKSFYIASDSGRDPYVESYSTAGKGLTIQAASLQDLLDELEQRWQKLYQYLTRNTSATVDAAQPYGNGVTLYAQKTQYSMDRDTGSYSASSLLFIAGVMDKTDRLAGMLSDDEESLRADSAYSWDFMKAFTEWAVVKEFWYVEETAGTYTLYLRYAGLLGLTRMSTGRTLSVDNIVGKSWKMKRGGATIRKVEYVNKGSVDDDREAIIVENKGSISENGWSVQGIFSAERDMYERYVPYDQVLYDNVNAKYYTPTALVTTGVNARKLLAFVSTYNIQSNFHFSTLIAPHPTPDVNVGLGAVTIGSTGSGFPSPLADIADSPEAAQNKSEATVVKALLADQDASSYGMAVARVLLFLFGNEENRLYTMTVDFITGSNSLMPHNVGDAYTIPASWISAFGGDDRAILTKAEIDWLGRTMAVELLNVYDTDITGA